MEKVYLFGSGSNAYGVIEYIGKENVIALVDNEIKKQGDYLHGRPIISFETLKEIYQGEEIVITAAMYKEIVPLLEENKIDNYSVAPMVIMGLPSPEEIIDEFNLYNKTSIYLVGCNIIAQKFYDYVINNKIGTKLFMVSLKEKSNKKKMMTYVSYQEIPCDATIVVFKENLDDYDIQNLKKYNTVYDIYNIHTNKLQSSFLMLKKYENKHRNGKCFIVGNGPSLKIEDLERIQKIGIPNFGFNLIYKIYPDTSWRPTYFVITEYNLYKTYYDEIIKLQHDNMFIKGFYCMENTPYIENVNYYPGYARRHYLSKQKFSNDISKVVYSGYSVMYDTLQIAVYMGFKEIYILGADFNYLNDSAGKGNHVYDYNTSERRKVAGKAYLDVTYNAFEVAKQYADSHEIKIYNATRGGKLEVFERKNLDEVFAEMENDKV